MLKTERLEIKSKRTVMDLPLLRKLKKFPFTTAFFAAMVVTVHIFPATVGLRGVPDDLGIRTDEKIFAPAFQLLPL